MATNRSPDPVQVVSTGSSGTCWKGSGIHHQPVAAIRHSSVSSVKESILRSATNNDLFLMQTRLKFGERAFSVAAPKAWNTLPLDVRSATNTDTFKTKLKTFLFRFFGSSVDIRRWTYVRYCRSVMTRSEIIFDRSRNFKKGRTKRGQ